LAKVQAELAALLMEPGRLEAFERDPKAHLRKAGLAGKDLELLAGLPVDGARYFAQRRRIDRFGYLRGDLPCSVTLMERETGLTPYFAAHPYAFEEPMREAARFAKWARGAAKEGALPRFVADVVQVEAAAVRLMHGSHRAAKPGARPKRAPGVRLVRVAHDPEHFLHAHPWTPEPGAFTVVLQRTADDVENPVLKPAELDALRAANGRRTEAQIVALLVAKGHPTAKATGAVAKLRRLGLIA
jgi:hypothetical protein